MRTWYRTCFHTLYDEKKLIIFIISLSLTLSKFSTRFLKCSFDICIDSSWLAAFDLALDVLFFLFSSFTVLLTYTSTIYADVALFIISACSNTAQSTDRNIRSTSFWPIPKLVSHYLWSLNMAVWYGYRDFLKWTCRYTFLKFGIDTFITCCLISCNFLKQTSATFGNWSI